MALLVWLIHPGADKLSDPHGPTRHTKIKQTTVNGNPSRSFGDPNQQVTTTT